MFALSTIAFISGVRDFFWNAACFERLKSDVENDLERIKLRCTLKVRELTGPARPRLKTVVEVG